MSVFRFLSTLSVLLFSVLRCEASSSDPKKNLVVCIHGLFGSTHSLEFIEQKLKQTDFVVENWGYDSKKAFISDHGEKLAEKLREMLVHHRDKDITFVAHSMGGLVLLAALNHPRCPDIARRGKAVLIASPMKGAWIARFVGRSSFARWIAHRFAGVELMTEKDFAHLGSYPRTLENICVIAGTWSMNPLLFEPNDGAVTVAETMLDVPHEHITIHAGHNDIVLNCDVVEMIKLFILKGRYKD